MIDKGVQKGINKDILKEILIDYKKDFSKRWKKEKFKWEAVKHFQDNWDIDADNFGKMFAKATGKTKTLLESNWNYAQAMIIKFAEFDAKSVKEMFINLYDEDKDIGERIDQFKSVAKDLFQKWEVSPSNDHPEWKTSQQELSSISTYLWLWYPDQYYVYKLIYYKTINKILTSDYIIIRNGSSKNAVDGFKLYDEICKELQSDNELRKLLQEHIDINSDYPDTDLKTLTIDFGYYINTVYNKKPIDTQPSKLKAINTEDKEEIENYEEDGFLNDVYMTDDQLLTIKSLLANKKNIILQGAPGVGKTFTAKRLAYSILGEKNNDFIKFIQFHQNYSYEDFIMGYKPTGDGFELKEGVFYRFCKKAKAQKNSDFFFIIDEINRGNISKIFGELLMLIENDYRDQEITLAYNDEKFSIPENLHIIGMMNTADRSLAMIDYALRRRFSFFDMKPAFDSNGFTKYQKGLKNDKLDNLIECIKKLNIEICDDPSLGESFAIGHSYFCGLKKLDNNELDERLKEIIDYDIIPLLKEYWFDDKNKVDTWKENFQKALNNG